MDYRLQSMYNHIVGRDPPFVSPFYFILLGIVRITSPKLRAMAVQYTGHVIQTKTHDNNTALPLVGVLIM